MQCYTFLWNIHSREIRRHKCTRSANDMWRICISVLLLANPQCYTCFADYSFLFSSLMLFILWHISRPQALRSIPFHSNRECWSFLLFFLCSRACISQYHSDGLLYQTLLYLFFFSFSELSFGLVFLVMACDQVLFVSCAKHKHNKNAVSDLKWKTSNTNNNSNQTISNRRKQSRSNERMKENKWKMQQFNNERPLERHTQTYNRSIYCCKPLYDHFGVFFLWSHYAVTQLILCRLTSIALASRYVQCSHR